jgi:signal transduction histidine kinase
MQSFQTIMTDMKAERVDLEKIIRVVIETNKSFCEQQGITVQTDFSAPQSFVQGDGLRLNQAFTNLVTNAIDAMPHGGTLTVRLWESNGALHTEVQDTGSGIPRAIKDRVFEPFVTTKDSHKGTGLGLALSQRIINQHQGKIDFETQEGCGTKFLVVLPKYVAPIGTASPVTQ